MLKLLKYCNRSKNEWSAANRTLKLVPVSSKFEHAQLQDEVAPRCSEFGALILMSQHPCTDGPDTRTMQSALHEHPQITWTFAMTSGARGRMVPEGHCPSRSPWQQHRPGHRSRRRVHQAGRGPPGNESWGLPCSWQVAAGIHPARHPSGISKSSLLNYVKLSLVGMK